MEDHRQMPEYTLYLAYSPQDVPHDRDALGNFIRKLNDIYRQRKDPLYLHLKEAEYAPEGAAGADLIISLSLKHAGGQELIRSIWDTHKGQALPPILTYFRQSDGEDTAETSQDFRRFLEDTTQHYWTQYSDISYVNCSVLMHLIMNLEVPVEIHADSLQVGDDIVFTLDDFAALRHSPALKELYGQLQQCEEDCLDLISRNEDYLQDPAYQAATERRAALRNKKQQLSETFFGLLRQFAGSKEQGDLTLRQQKAQEALMTGELEAAKRVLDEEEIRAAQQDSVDQIRKLEAQIAGLKEQIARNVRELLTKIDILKLEFSPSVHEIDALYETAMDWEREYDLPRTATESYLRYLTIFDRFTQARDAAQDYLQDALARCDRKAQAEAYDCLARCDDHTGNNSGSLSNWEKTEALLCELKDEDPQTHFSSWATAFIQLAACRNRCGENTAAIRQLRDALADFEKYESLDREASLFAQGWAHLQLETCYRHQNWTKALGEATAAKKLFDRLGGDKHAYEQIACGICIANCYVNLQQHTDAKSCLRELESLVQGYLAQSPREHLMHAVTYFDVRGRLYTAARNPSKEDLSHAAKDLETAQKLLQLYRQYVGEDAEHDILAREVSIYRGLSRIDMEYDQLDDAIAHNLEAQSRLETLVSHAPGVHLSTLADNIWVLGGLYSRRADSDGAKAALSRVLDLVKEYDHRIPLFSPTEKAVIYQQYASLIFKTEDREAAVYLLPFLTVQLEQEIYTEKDQCLLRCALGFVYSALNRWADAAEAFRPAQQALDASSVTVDVTYALQIYVGLGRALFFRKQHKEAAVRLESARRIYMAYERFLTNAALEESIAMCRLLAKVYNKLNRGEDARRSIEQAKELEQWLAKRKAAGKEGSV